MSTYTVETPRDYVAMNSMLSRRFIDDHANDDGYLLGTFPGGPYPAGMYDFLLAHAREWDGHARPLDIPLGRMKECFKNAAQLIMRDWDDALTYCEGYADTGVFPVHHAWVVDGEGRVIDTTWRERGRYGHEAPASDWRYFGVPFTRHGLYEALAHGTYGVLDKIDYKEPIPEGWLRGDVGCHG